MHVGVTSISLLEFSTRYLAPAYAVETQSHKLPVVAAASPLLRLYSINLFDRSTEFAPAAMGKRKSNEVESPDSQEDSGKRKKERSGKKGKRNRMETILQAAAAAAERAAAAKEAAEAAAAVAAAEAADAPSEQPQAVAGSHDADAAAAAHMQQAADEPAHGSLAAATGERRKAGGKPAPVLPWMRVPIAIEASEGALLEEVQGLDPRLRRALEGGPKAACLAWAGSCPPSTPPAAA